MDPFSDGFFGGGFEEIINQLTKGSRQQRNYSNETNSFLNTIEKKKELTFVLDVSGKENIHVNVRDELEEDNYGEKFATGKKILEIKSGDNEKMKIILPKTLKQKNMEHTLTNGILEVKFKKWNQKN